MSTLALAPAVAATDRRRWLALAVVLVAAFMDLLDVTIVNVAVPGIQQDLRAGYAAVEWVTAGYALAFAAVLISGGRLGDLYGRKRLLLIGMAGFTVASALCGLAVGPGMLIGARVLQGAMAALMVPQVLAVIQVTFPAEERGKVFGLYGAIGALAVVAGPILGGLFVQSDLFGWHWRPIFLVNLPVGLAGMAAAAVFVRESRSPTARRLDVLGAILATAGVLLLLYPLTEGHELGWPAWTFALMAASVPVLAVFVLHERRLIARGGAPLIVLDLFRARSFAGGFGVNLLFNLAYGTFFLMWTLYMQLGLGWTALHAGLTGVPFFVGLAVAAGTAVQFLTPRFGRKVLLAGGLCLIAGAVLLLLDSQWYGPAVHSWQMAPALVVMGAGMGFVVAPVVDFALNDVPPEAAGSASGVIGMTQQLGSAIGIALVGVVFLAALGGQAGHGVDSVAPAVRQELAAVGVPTAAQDDILAGFRTCTRDRAGERDPGAVPASCRPAAGQPAAVGRILTEHAPAVRAETFSRAYRLGLRTVVGLLVLVTLLMPSLPRRARPQQP